MSVSARMKQYGAMRAIGMSNHQLIKMVTAEATTYAFAGSIVGCMIGLSLHRFLFERMVTYRWGDSWNIPCGVIAIIVALVIVAAFIAVHNPVKRIRNMSREES